MPPRRIRLLHVIQNLNYGGMERLLADLVRRLDPERFECHVLVLQYPGRFASGLAPFARVHLADPLPRLSLLWPGPLARQIRRIAPDVVHTHSGVWLKAATAARMAGTPLRVHTEHGRRFPDPLQDRLIDRVAARRTTTVVAVSRVLAEQLEAEVVRGACPVRVIANGVDTTAFAPGTERGALRRSLGIPPATFVLGSVGRLEPVKGYEVMLDAFAELLRRTRPELPPALLLAGDGSVRRALQERARELGIAERVHFLGWRDDVRELLAAFDLFTLSSRSEGTSVSLLEAMSTGLPPVVTEVGGNGAVLGERLRHRLVPPEKPEALAEAWARDLADPAARAADGRAARERVCTSFSLDAMVREYEEVYGRAAARGRG